MPDQGISKTLVKIYGSLGWPPKFQHWFLEFEHCIFEVECMTSALDEMVRHFVRTISLWMKIKTESEACSDNIICEDIKDQSEE